MATLAQLRVLTPETLLQEIHRLENSLAHLHRSNAEMETFDPLGEDVEIVQAINENVDVMRRQEVRIELAKRVLREVGTGHALEEENTGVPVGEFREEERSRGVEGEHLNAHRNGENDEEDAEGIFM